MLGRGVRYLAGEEATHADDAEDVEHSRAHDGPHPHVTFGDEHPWEDSETHAHITTRQSGEVIVHRLTFTAAAQPSRSCQNTCKYHVAVAAMASELSAPLNVNDTHPHTQANCTERPLESFASILSAAHKFNSFQSQYERIFFFTFCVNVHWGLLREIILTNNRDSGKEVLDRCKSKFRLGVVPMTDVKSSGAELPAAMKVAPATSSLRLRRCEAKT